MSAEPKVSPRKDLADFTERGRLRDAAHDAGLSEGACDLLVRVVQRYVEPRRSPRRAVR